MNNKDFTIIPTNACDMKCEFCHEKNKKCRIDLKNNDIDSFLNSIIKNIDDIEEGIPISLFGGEPLLNKGSLIFLSEHKYAKYIDIRIFTNLNNFDFEDLYFLSSFKKATINTNLDVFQDRLFYKTKKYKIIKYIQENTNINLIPHCIISKDKMEKILYYAPKLKIQKEYMKDINLYFDVIFPDKNDYDINDYVNLITFYKYIDDESLFHFNIYKIVNFIDFINSDYIGQEKCDINSCNELTMDNKGKILPCRRFYNYQYTETEIKKIELNSKKCNNCKFNNFCEVCKYSHHGIDNTNLKCRRVYNILKALEYIELKGLNKIDDELFILSINVGNKCDKKCSFCYVDKNNPETINLKNLKSFIKNNYWKIKELDTLLGGEPLLYLNEEYEFLKQYFDELHIISNTYSKNEYVKNNHDFIKITMSIQDGFLNKLNYEYYKKNIECSLVLLNNDVLDNIFEIIKMLEMHNINYKFTELYSYRKGDNLLDDTKIKDVIKISKMFKNIDKACIKSDNDDQCIYKKINIDKNKVTVCGTLYYGAEVLGEKEKYILSYNLKNYIINKDDIYKKISNLNKLDKDVCIANQYSVYENIDIRKKILEELNDR